MFSFLYHLLNTIYLLHAFFVALVFLFFYILVKIFFFILNFSRVSFYQFFSSTAPFYFKRNSLEEPLFYQRCYIWIYDEI